MQSVYSKLTIARESATIACVWQRNKGRQESGKVLEWEKKGKF